MKSFPRMSFWTWPGRRARSFRFRRPWAAPGSASRRSRKYQWTPAPHQPTPPSQTLQIYKQHLFIPYPIINILREQRQHLFKRELKQRQVAFIRADAFYEIAQTLHPFLHQLRTVQRHKSQISDVQLRELEQNLIVALQRNPIGEAFQYLFKKYNIY